LPIPWTTVKDIRSHPKDASDGVLPTTFNKNVSVLSNRISDCKQLGYHIAYNLDIHNLDIHNLDILR